MKRPPGPAALYLAASSHRPTLAAMATRALATIERRPVRIAISHAAAGGPHAAHLNGVVERLFDGARVVPFTVAGQADAMSPSAARAIVADADLVFLGGGDPVQGAHLLADSGADAWLRDARARGVPCMGLSAGAIMLCAWWAEWPDHPAAGAPHDGGELVPCAGVAPDLVVDCHAEDDDWAELKLVRAMLQSRLGAAPLPRFLGLPSGTGIIVREGAGPGAKRAFEHVGGAPFVLEGGASNARSGHGQR